MLRDIKQQSSGLGFKIIMGLIIISFVFWGVSGSLMSSANDGAATVNGEKISIDKFNQANQAQKSRMTSQFGDNIGLEYFESENFKRGVMNQLVDAELLRQQAQKFDYDVAPAKIKEYIESSPGLQIDGKFSMEAYANFLAQVNKSAELLQRDIKEDIQSAAFPQLVSTTAFSLQTEIEQQYKLSKQKRDFDYIELASKDYEDKVEISDEEITNHYSEFGQEYKTQEQVSVNYIELSAADLGSEIEVTDEDIQQSYEDKKESLMTAEKRKTQHILLSVNKGNEDEVKAKIDKIAERIKAGEDFAEVAKEVSEDPGSAKNGGDLGLVAQGDMVEAFDEKLFSMQEGEVSEPILSTFGYHIIKLNKIQSPEVPKLEDIKATLIEELKKSKAEELFLTRSGELDTLIVDSDNVIEIAAEDSGLELKSTELFAQGRGLGIAANANFSKTAFSDLIKIDEETSGMIDLGENHIAYLHIKEYKPSVIKPLEEVKEQITNKIKSEKAMDLVKQEAENYAKQINDKEKDLAAIALELGKEVVEARDVERVGSKQPFNLVKNVFKLKNDEQKAANVVESSSLSVALVELKKVTEADLSALTEDEKKNIATQIERTASNNEMQNLSKELRENASISINDRVFESNL